MSIPLQVGMVVPVRRLCTAWGELDLCSGNLPTHIQFRRFAGCPVCSMHLREFVTRATELSKAMRELVVFHSSASELIEHIGAVPFAVVADPSKNLYRSFGVESGRRALLGPRGWMPIGRAVLTVLLDLLRRQRARPPFNPAGGRLSLPADFMVRPDGMISACHYGEHIDDSWSVDEALGHATRCSLTWQEGGQT